MKQQQSDIRLLKRKRKRRIDRSTRSRSHKARLSTEINLGNINDIVVLKKHWLERLKSWRGTCDHRSEHVSRRDSKQGENWTTNVPTIHSAVAWCQAHCPFDCEETLHRDKPRTSTHSSFLKILFSDSAGMESMGCSCVHCQPPWHAEIQSDCKLLT